MKLGSQLLWLTEKDVAALLPMKDAVTVMEGAFRSHGLGHVQMPVKVYLQFDPFGGDLRAMPAYIKGPKPMAGVKIVNSNAKNPSKGLPAVAGIMVLNDPETGLPCGVFAAGNLTSIRTGAAGGVAAKYLARRSSARVGLIGCGRQARTQLQALVTLFPIEQVVAWSVVPGEVEALTKDVRKFYKGKIERVMSAQAACDADIIVTTTPVKKPVIEASWIRPGTHINAIGADAPGKQELSSDLLNSSTVVVDSWDQASHAGEINVPVSAKSFTKTELAAELGEIVAGFKKGRVSEAEITIFDSTGLALQDVAIGFYLLNKALKLKKGKVLNLYG